VHKLERILSQLLPRISCCLDKVKHTGVPRMVVRGFDPVQYSDFFKLCMCLHTKKFFFHILLQLLGDEVPQTLYRELSLDHNGDRSSPDPLTPPLLHNS